MNFLRNYYKNLCEELEQEINFLESSLLETNISKAKRLGDKYPQLMTQAAERQRRRFTTRVDDLETLSSSPENVSDLKSAALQYARVASGRVSPRQDRKNVTSLVGKTSRSKYSDDPQTTGDVFWDRADPRGQANIPDDLGDIMSNLQSLAMQRLKSASKKRKKKGK
jgi:hypothetical protein